MQNRSVHIFFWCFILLIGANLVSTTTLNPSGKMTVITGDSLTTTADPIKIGIAEEDFDPIDEILDDMGLTYTWFSWDEYGSYPDHLENLTAMRQFDLIFLPCGGDAAYPSTLAADNIRQYVQEGGVIYASDWARGVMDAAFPGKIEFLGDGEGATGTSYLCSVEDDALRAFIGNSTIDIVYDLGAWEVINTVASDVVTLIRGDVPTYYGTLSNKPLAVRFSYGYGTVIYTSFHNEAQISAQIQMVLEYYISTLLGFTLLYGVYSQINSQNGQILRTFVGNMTQGDTLYLNLTQATKQLLQERGFFDIFLNWEGSEFELLVDGVPTGTGKPLKASFNGDDVGKNFTIHAKTTTGHEMSITAFVIYGSGGGGIPGFEFLFGILSFTAVIIVFLRRRLN